jgi:hypothetical protein
MLISYLPSLAFVILTSHDHPLAFVYLTLNVGS